MSCWYAVCCKPRQETIAEENLQRQGFHVYLPRLQVKQRRRGKWVDIVEALFPRYLFIRIDPLLQSTAPIRSTRGAIDLIRFGDRPALVPNEVIDALLLREDTKLGSHRDMRPLFHEGESVKIVTGALAGMEGIFALEDGEERVVVLLELLGKTNQIKVNRDYLVRAA